MYKDLAFWFSLLSLGLATCQSANQEPSVSTQIVSIPSPSVDNIEVENTALPKSTSTLSVSEFTKRLLEENGGCEYPCYWGITPGDSWSETLESLEPYISGLDTKFLENSVHLSYPDPRSEEQAGSISTAIRVVNDKVDLIYAGGIETDLQAILRSYGVPDEIWFHVQNESSPGPVADYELAINYSSLGMLFVQHYHIPETGLFIVCPVDEENDAIYFELWLYSPDTTRSFEEISGTDLFKWRNPFEFSSIEQISDYDVDSFFDTYIAERDGFICFAPTNGE